MHIKMLFILTILLFFMSIMSLDIKTVKAEDPPKSLECCKLVTQEDGSIVEVCSENPNYGGGPCQFDCW